MQANIIGGKPTGSYGVTSKKLGLSTVPVTSIGRGLKCLAVILFLVFAGITFMPNSERALEDNALTTSQSAPLIYKLPSYFAYIVICVLLVLRTQRLRRKFIENKWIILVLTLVFLSALWSQEPLQSIKTGVFLFLLISLAMWFAEQFTTIQQMQVVMAVGGLCAFLCISVAIVSPDLAYGMSDRTAWQGVFYSKNHCGRMMLFLLLPAFHYPWRIRVFKWAYIIFILVVIGMSKSATAWILTVAYGIYVLATSLLTMLNKGSRRIVLLCFALASVCVISMAAINLDSISTLAGKDMVLTGRPLIWKALFASAIKQPILGYGYDAFWTGQSGEAFTVITATHSAFGFTGMYSHNGYLDVLLQLGFVGVAIILLSLLRGLKMGWICLSTGSNLSAIAWYLGIMLLSTFYNTVEVTFLLPKYLPWLMYVFASVGLSDEMLRRKQLMTYDSISLAA